MKKILLFYLSLTYIISSCNKENVTINDSKGFLIDSIYTYTYNGLSDSINSVRSFFNYDKKGNTISSSKYYFQSNNNQWNGDNKNEYEYNELGSITKEIHYNWDINVLQWFVVFKKENYYSAGNQLIGIEETNYDTETKLISYASKFEYSINNSGRRLSSVSYRMNLSTNTWIAQEKTEYGLDENGLRVSSLEYLWNTMDNSWKISGKTIDISDNNGNLIKSVFYSYNSLNDSYTESSKYLASYDANGNATSQESYLCNKGVYGAGLYKVEKEFDADDNILSETYYDWDHLTLYVLRKLEYTRVDGKLVALEAFVRFPIEYPLHAWFKEDYYYNSNGSEKYSLFYEWKNSSYIKKEISIYFSSKSSIIDSNRKSLKIIGILSLDKKNNVEFQVKSPDTKL